MRIPVSSVTLIHFKAMKIINTASDIAHTLSYGPQVSLNQKYYHITMTRRASHPQYTMGILGSRIMDKGPGVQVG